MLTRDFPPPAEGNFGVLPPPGFMFAFPVLGRKTGRSRIQRTAGSSPGCYKCQPWASPFGSGSLQPRGGWGFHPRGGDVLGLGRFQPRTFEGRASGDAPGNCLLPLKLTCKPILSNRLEAEATEAECEELRPPCSLRWEHEQLGPPPLPPSRLLREDSPEATRLPHARASAGCRISKIKPMAEQSLGFRLTGFLL